MRILFFLLVLTIFNSCNLTNGKTPKSRLDCLDAINTIVTEDSILTEKAFNWQEQFTSEAKKSEGKLDTNLYFNQLDSIIRKSNNLITNDEHYNSILKSYYTYLKASSLQNARLTLYSYQLQNPSIEEANYIFNALEVINKNNIEWFDTKQIELDSFVLRCQQ